MKDKPVSVLIVDDDMETIRSLKDSLAKRGLRAVTAPTGASAMANLEKECMDLVLLDIGLPDRAGLEVLRESRRDHPDTKVIMMTDFGYDESLVDESMRLGANGYITKGSHLREILESVENALAG
jgi:two-component system, OmpR family, KDP operon response regulator KdpE